MNDRHEATITPEQLAALGAESVVYIKPVLVDGVTTFAINNGAGQTLGMADSKAQAQAAALHYDLEVAALH